MGRESISAEVIDRKGGIESALRMEENELSDSAEYSYRGN